MFFLTTRPLWVTGTAVIVLTLLATFGPVLVRRRVGLRVLSTNNEVAGFKFATVGVLYAVLLAFAVVIMWEKLSSAEDGVAAEAGTAATIYRLSEGIPGAPGADLRTKMTVYLQDTVSQDWPAMEQGGENKATTDALNDVYAAVLRFEPSGQKEVAVFAETLHQLDLLTQSRRARLITAEGLVPEVLWAVLLGGAAVTISFTFFFGTENLRAQAMMTGILSFLIFSSLLIVVTLDHPFAGPVKVEPLPLVRVLSEFYLPRAS